MPASRHDVALRVSSIRQEVLLAREHPDPERVRRRLHDALVSRLPGALDAAFSGPNAPTDDAVWRIRRLDVDVSVNVAWDDDELARVWALRLSGAVERAMATGGDGVTVVRFPSRAAYVASFVRDTAHGTASSAWWYDTFAGLRLLTRSAAIRSALLRDRAMLVQTLAILRADSAIVASQLTPQDARSLLDAIASVGDDPAGAEDILARVLTVHDALGGPSPRADVDRWVFRLVVETLGDSRHGVSRELIPMARAFARVVAIAEEDGVAAARARLAAYARTFESDGDATLEPLARAPRATLDKLFERVAMRANHKSTRVARDLPEVTWMPVAAPLLLAPIVAALPLDEHVRGWAASDVRLLVLATACGGERALRVMDDPTTQLLAGVVEKPASLKEVSTEHVEQLEAAVRARSRFDDGHRPERTAAEEAWLALPAAMGARPEVERALISAARVVLRELANKLPGFATASVPHLWTNFLSMDAHVVHEETRIVAHVGRPPLALILTMTGLLRSTYRLPWLGNRVVQLFPADVA